MAVPKFDNSTNISSNIADVYGLDQLITKYTRITDKSPTKNWSDFYKYSRYGRLLRGLTYRHQRPQLSLLLS